MDNIRCPKCSSNNVVSGRNGFGFGRAAVGALLLGPIGLLAGGMGSKTIISECLDCKHIWNHASYLRSLKEKEELERKQEKLKQKWKNIFNKLGGN